jgi:hypothetical protein
LVFVAIAGLMAEIRRWQGVLDRAAVRHFGAERRDRRHRNAVLLAGGKYGDPGLILADPGIERFKMAS